MIAHGLRDPGLIPADALEALILFLLTFEASVFSVFLLLKFTFIIQKNYKFRFIFCTNVPFVICLSRAEECTGYKDRMFAYGLRDPGSIPVDALEALILFLLAFETSDFLFFYC